MRTVTIEIGTTRHELSTEPAKRLLVAFVGETITAGLRPLVGDLALTVSRAPSASEAEVDGADFEIDEPGEYAFVLNDDAGEQPLSFRVVAVPVAALDDLRIKEPHRVVTSTAIKADPKPRSEPEIRAALQGFALDALLCGRDLAATFDGATEIPSGVDWLRWLPADGR